MIPKDFDKLSLADQEIARQAHYETLVWYGWCSCCKSKHTGTPEQLRGPCKVCGYNGTDTGEHSK